MAEGKGKITPQRIARLNSIGFEWDPQKARWDQMFQRLLKFKDDNGHCKVPKGYRKDRELANWVRNQRLERANILRGRKVRMTEERFRQLDDVGFKWSSPNVKCNSQSQPDDTANLEGNASLGATSTHQHGKENNFQEVASANAGIGRSDDPSLVHHHPSHDEDSVKVETGVGMGR